MLSLKTETDGWTLMKEGNSPKYLSDFNVLISSPTDRSPATPEENLTGYFLKLTGSAVYSNGDTPRAYFSPSAN